MKKIKSILSFRTYVRNLFLISLLFYGCDFIEFVNEHSPKYGRSYNNERKEIGIPVISDELYHNESYNSYTSWVNKKASDHSVNSPYHLSKIVSYPNSILTSEKDVFFYPINDSIDEQLWITFSYLDSTFSSKYFSLNNKSDSISLDSALNVLNDWGLSDIVKQHSK